MIFILSIHFKEIIHQFSFLRQVNSIFCYANKMIKDSNPIRIAEFAFYLEWMSICRWQRRHYRYDEMNTNKATRDAIKIASLVAFCGELFLSEKENVKKGVCKSYGRGDCIAESGIYQRKGKVQRKC